MHIEGAVTFPETPVYERLSEHIPFSVIRTGYDIFPFFLSAGPDIRTSVFLHDIRTDFLRLPVIDLDQRMRDVLLLHTFGRYRFLGIS